MKSKITITCCLCRERYTDEIDLPEGWRIRYDDIDEENGFCPKHSLVAKWAEAQCPGCVGGWGDCSLWDNFAYSGRRNLSQQDFNTIKAGICPKRVNGTFMVGSNGTQEVILSETATTAEGEILAQAIIDYWERYPEHTQ